MKNYLVLTYIFFCSLTSQAQDVFPALPIDSTEVGKCISHLNFAQAETLLKKEITLAKRQKKSTANLEQQQKNCTFAKTALRNTDKLVIVDSLVVPKSELLSAYLYSPEVGSIEMENGGKTTSYTTERKNRTIKVGLSPDSILTLQMLYNDVEKSNAARPQNLKGLNISGDVNYPFLMMDGITLYFAGINNEGLGNYDLYVTRSQKLTPSILQKTSDSLTIPMQMTTCSL